MKIIETQHEGEPTWLYKFGNWSAVDEDSIHTIGIAWLFKEDGKWVFTPRLTGNASLFYNAVFFCRFNWFWPGFFWSFRWSPSTDSKALLQSGIGWKCNGRFAITLRIQSDKTSAAGVTGPNLGQSTGYDYGPH